MHKYAFALLLLIILFVSCKKEPKDPAARVAGTWHCTGVNHSSDQLAYNTVLFDTSINVDRDITITNSGRDIYVNAGEGYDGKGKLMDMGGKLFADEHNENIFESERIPWPGGLMITLQYDSTTNEIKYWYRENTGGYRTTLLLKGTRK